MVGKLKYILIAALFLIVLDVTKVHAECNYERTAELSRIASNVQLSYTYDIGENVIFDVTLTNLTNDIYIEDEDGNVISGVGEKTLSYDHGRDIEYTIYSNDQNCYGEKLLTSYISLPNFNEYSNFAGCAHYPQFKYCQLWYNTESISSEQFYSELKAYAEKEDAANTNAKIEKTSIWEAFKTVLSENLVMVIMCGVAIGILILIIVMKKIHKTR